MRSALPSPLLPLIIYRRGSGCSSWGWKVYLERKVRGEGGTRGEGRKIKPMLRNSQYLVRFYLPCSDIIWYTNLESNPQRYTNPRRKQHNWLRHGFWVPTKFGNSVFISLEHTEHHQAPHTLPGKVLEEVDGSLCHDRSILYAVCMTHRKSAMYYTVENMLFPLMMLLSIVGEHWDCGC